MADTNQAAASLRHVFAVTLDGELYLFERALHAEKFAYASRAQGPTVLGGVQVRDADSAQQLLTQLLPART